MIAYGCLMKEARREHLDYKYRGLMSHHQRTKLICDKNANITFLNSKLAA